MSYALKDLPTARAQLDAASAPEAPAQTLPSTMLGDDPAAFGYLLLVRFGLVNMVGFALAAAFALSGWAGDIVLGDRTHVTEIIIATFIVGLALCAMRVWRTSLELNAVRSGLVPPASRVAAYLRAIEGADSGGRALIASSLRLKLNARIVVIRQFASTLVMLGLIGTVIGFIIALSGVDPSSAADASAIGPMVANLVDGMAVALNTTLVGAVLNIWLGVNYQLLAAGTANMVAAVVAMGESRARS